MPKLDDQISTLQERLQQLKLRHLRLDARKRASEALRERKLATRRKILVGGVMLAKVQQGEIDPQQFAGWLDQALVRADDRALFDLPPRHVVGSHGASVGVGAGVDGSGAGTVEGSPNVKGASNV
jgi:hypothetical protein